LHNKSTSKSVLCEFSTKVEDYKIYFPLKVGWKDQQERIVKGEQLNARVQLDYPISNVFGREINIQVGKIF